MRGKGNVDTSKAVVILAVGALCWAPIAAAQDDGAPARTGPLSKLSVHGFLTQAYATADFATGGFSSPTADEIILGIPEDGTSDYRSMAIQFRYEISPKDVMIIQFSSRSLGESPIQDVEDEIELDWAFYERRLTDHTSLKVGRVQIPFGIFNEIRDVGTILPFYRPPFAFYREGSFTSETVDGVVLSHTFGAQSDWSLEADVYFGEWDLVETNFLESEGITRLARVADAIGFQLWLNTPVSGLRFGVGGHQRDVSGGWEGLFRPIGGEDTFDEFYLSLEYVNEKFVVRSEYREFSADPDPVFFGGTFPLGYIQIGYHPTEKFRIYAQYEFADAEHTLDELNTTFPPFAPATEAVQADLRRDTGIALNYVFSPNVVLKLEHHFDVDMESFDFVPAFAPGVPFPIGLQPVYATASDGEYSILSLSASF